jgi:hypothetical protein
MHGNEEEKHKTFDLGLTSAGDPTGRERMCLGG